MSSTSSLQHTEASSAGGMVKGKSLLGPAAPQSLLSPVSPRRVFRNVNYPKRITRTAANYLSKVQTLVGAYLPWMSHLHLCVYHVWALIWALARPWRSPMWHALLWYQPVLYPLIVQRCFLLHWLWVCLRSHNWRGPALNTSSYIIC